MPSSVGQALPQNGVDVLGDLPGHLRVNRTFQPERGGKADDTSGVLHLGEHPSSHTLLVELLVPFLQREDRCANELDGLVDVVDRSAYAFGDGWVVDHPSDALKRHAGCEEPLDRKVVQILGYSVPVLKYGQLLGVPAATGQLERDRRLPREGSERLRNRGTEWRPTGTTADHEHAAHPIPLAERHGPQRTKPARRVQSRISRTARSRIRGHRVGARLGHRGREGTLRREGGPQDLIGVQARRGLDDKAVGTGDWNRDGRQVRISHVQRLGGEKRQDSAGLGAGKEATGDLRAGPEPALPAPYLLKEPGILDRDTSSRRQRRQQLLVFLVEV